MKIENKKVKEAIEKLGKYNKENRTGDAGFSLRTDNERPDIYKNKYILYNKVDGGYVHPGTFGAIVGGFKTQKEFIEWVENL